MNDNRINGTETAGSGIRALKDFRLSSCTKVDDLAEHQETASLSVWRRKMPRKAAWPR
jgi:hypothetical protein